MSAEAGSGADVLVRLIRENRLEWGRLFSRWEDLTAELRILDEQMSELNAERHRLESELLGLTREDATPERMPAEST